MENVYYHPEAWGLEVVAVLDASQECEFDLASVWRDPLTGDVFGARSSGCSCPTPFEEYQSRADLTPIKEIKDATRLAEYVFEPGLADVNRFITAVAAVLP